MSPIDPKAFWTVASGFPGNKEEVYPEHADAQEFDKVAGKVILEYGCGGGADTLSYLRRGCSVIYSDIVPANVLKTQKVAAAAGYSSKAKPLLLKQSAVLGVPSNFVDVVNCHGVLHHIASSATRDEVLREFHRVLKPKGKLYLMLYTEMLWERFEATIASHVSEHSISREEAFGWCTDGRPCPYATCYTTGEATSMLDQCGFFVDSTVVYNGGDFRTFRCTKS